VLLASIPSDRDVLPREPLQELADTVLGAVDAAIATAYVDGDRLAIQGWSFGGFATIGVIAQTNRFKAAIAVAGIYDFQSHYGVQRISDRLAAEFDGLYFDLDAPIGNVESDQIGMGAPPWRDPQRYLRNSPLTNVESIQTPVMLMHGDLDYTVSLTQSEELFTALYRLNKDATFVRYWGEGHDLPVSPANIRDYWARVFRWYDEHIGPPYSSSHASIVEAQPTKMSR
jgi:dipeptidyl aminopeptidase/acylaminoacyl peptidase